MKKEEEEGREEVVRRRMRRLRQLSKIYRDYYWSLIEHLKSKHRHYCFNSSSSRCCEVHSCRKKSMPLTAFCHSHILSDLNQLLYKPCSYPTKHSPSGPTLCMKPILKSAVPSLCSSHLEKAEKHLSRCLRKEGFNVLGTNKYPPKFNVVVAEFVRQIQSNRRENL